MAETRNALTDVVGISVGHWSDIEAGTGCTVILTPDGATAGVDIRGSAPGTRETDLLDPTMLVDQVHGLLLSGGSAFGLSAADGVVRWLREKGHGWPTPVTNVPIVPAAILFDLAVGQPDRWPGADDAYEACEAASAEDTSRGSVGAGVGCTVGKFLGLERACRGGLGQASVSLPGGVVVAALAAVNSYGDIVDPAARAIVAGARDTDTEHLVDALRVVQERFDRLGGDGSDRQSTTLGVVATNATLNKAQATKLAQMAHDGLARTTRPSHTMYDGDCIFAVSTGETERPVELSLVGAVGAEVFAAAILDGVRSADSNYGLPSLSGVVPRLIGSVGGD